MSRDPALLALAESVADGSVTNWESAEACATSEEKAVIRQLRILSDLAFLHRTMPVYPAGESWPEAVRRSLTAPAIGTWGHLALLERLGSGTFGEVYRAWDRQLEREVALKLRRADADVDDLQASRIAREGRLLARLQHPNVITVHGVGVHDQRVGLWMELVRGATLEDVLRRQGTFGAREAALVGIDLCRALAAIHAAGLAHRDVKAQNVMREDGGRIVLMDLGTGREIGPGEPRRSPDRAGTPLYLAPEIFTGAAATQQSDLYSLGVLLYHLVTGAFPVRATTIEELEAGHKNGTAVRLRDARADLPTPFVRVVDRAIAADPARRYETVGALEADLVSALEDPAVIVRPADTTPAPTRHAAWRAGALVASLLALAVLGLGLRGEPAFEGRSPAAVPSHISMLAVLPFQNLSTDAGDGYLADAVPMELTTRLGQIGALKVVPWTFMKRFDVGSQPSFKEVARRTGADAVIEGAVQRVPGENGSRGPVQVRVQVFQASTGALLWSDSFERDIGDFFALQAQIAREIAGRVHVVLAARDQALVSRSRRVPPEAMEDYLNARYLLDVQMNLDGAIELFLRATARAPDFAEAYVGLATSYALQSAFFGSVPSTVGFQRALDASNRALTLDSTMPEAWGARAFARFALEWNWKEAESDFRRALELGPTSVDVLEAYSNYLSDRGRHAEAIEAGRKAEERAPMSASASRQVAWAYYMAHDYDTAIQQLARTIAIEPDYVPAHTLLGRAYLLKGRTAEAIRELKRVGQAYQPMLAMAHAAAGQRQEARRLLDEIRSPSYKHPVIPYQVALAYVAMGDANQALAWLERAYREKDSGLTELAVDPMIDAIRTQPRYVALLARLNLP